MAYSIQRATSAWIFQTVAMFIISLTLMVVGIINLPVDLWMKGFMGMGLLFTIGASFTVVSRDVV